MNSVNRSPLSDRLRPQDLVDFVGQEHLTAEGKLLTEALKAGELPSLILWGPPGTGKTTLALILAKKIEAEFVRFSAVTEGVKDLRRVIDAARNNRLLDKQTVLFIDEIHRWNKAQQDALLPHLESGDLILIGATTENPSFEIRGALLSRCRVLVLKQLESPDLIKILQRALSDKTHGLGDKNLQIDQTDLELIANLSGGDARAALNILESASLLAKEITPEIIKEAAHKTAYHDKSGESHYNLISALHKSLRGSDADAGLYWLARLIEGGEDPLYIARRLVRFASEDVGLANSRALEQAVAVYQAVHFLGYPECNVHLAQLVVYLAKCQKSNALYVAINQASALAAETNHLPVPLHLRNAPTSLMKDLGYGEGYKYSPNYNYQEEQTYLPDEIKDKKFLNRK